MILNNILQEDNNTTIEEARYIEITKKTVKFGDDVYQFRNVSGFGVAEIKKSIPIKFILVLFIAGLFVTVIPGARMWGVLMLLVSIGIVVDEVVKPKRYGFKLYINSGDGKIFITNDIDGIKKVVSTLYEFMESNEEGSYAINIRPLAKVAAGVL
jgi:hypothetical protein